MIFLTWPTNRICLFTISFKLPLCIVSLKYLVHSTHTTTDTQTHKKRMNEWHNIRLTAIFQDNQGELVPSCLHSGLYELRMMEVVVATLNYKMCKAVVKLPPTTNQHQASYTQDAMSPTWQCHWRESTLLIWALIYNTNWRRLRSKNQSVTDGRDA